MPYFIIYNREISQTGLVVIHRDHGGLSLVINEEHEMWAEPDHREFLWPNAMYLGTLEVTPKEFRHHLLLAEAFQSGMTMHDLAAAATRLTLDRTPLALL